MTTTFDPHEPAYLDEADARHELTRTFEVCGQCRACIDLCDVFPTLFDLLDATTANDPGLLTPDEQDAVVDECFHCDRCVGRCPYAPELHEASIDVPRLVLRVNGMRANAGQRSIVHGLAGGAAARLAALRRLAGVEGGSGPGSTWRGPVVGVAERLGFGDPAVRLLAPSKGERFSAWFARHTPQLGRDRRGKVGVYPTCLVEYQASGVGRDLVAVFEHGGIECERSAAGCCGAPWLHAGDLGRFRKMANDNVDVLAAEIRAGGLDAIVVPEPTCRSVMQREYSTHVDAPRRADAELVVDHLADPAAHLRTAMAGGRLHPVSDGEVPMVAIGYHVACHARSDASTSPGLDLLVAVAAGLGSEISVIEGCAGIGGRWDRPDDDRTGRDRADELGLAPWPDLGPTGHRADMVVGDCSLANQAIAGASGAGVLHPMSALAAVLGLDHPDDADRDARPGP